MSEPASAGSASQATARRSSSRTGIGRRSTRCTTLNTAVPTPMPSARIRAMAVVDPGRRSRRRRAWRRASRKLSTTMGGRLLRIPPSSAQWISISIWGDSRLPPERRSRSNESADPASSAAIAVVEGTIAQATPTTTCRHSFAFVSIPRREPPPGVHIREQALVEPCARYGQRSHDRIEEEEEDGGDRQINTDEPAGAARLGLTQQEAQAQ